MSITPGPRCEALIKGKEKLRLVAYKPTPNDRWTIGWGHTKTAKPGMKITEQRAQELFLSDIGDAVNSVDLLSKKLASKGISLTQSMIDALISLVYNAGAGSISSGNTIGKSLIAGDYYSACQGFFAYRKQTNLKTGELENIRGLAIRRCQEMLLFLEDGVPQ